jgi:hypothetical protein
MRRRGNLEGDLEREDLRADLGPGREDLEMVGLERDWEEG